mgnify:CR=1 FL=1
MTEKRIEFNSRLQDIFKDHLTEDDEPLSYEDLIPEEDCVEVIQTDPFKDHQVRCLVRYYCSFRDKQYREILQKLAEILYKAERRSL